MNKTFGALLSLALVVLGGWYLLTRAPSAPDAGDGATTASAYTFYCARGRTLGAQFSEKQVTLTLSDGRTLALPQTISGSGVRYEATTTGADIVFSSKGDNAYLTENGETTYGQCTAADIRASDAPGYQTYADIGRTFSFTFPSDFTVTGSEPGFGTGWSVVATSTGQVLARINVPRSFEPGTNFSEAWFTVGVSADPQAVAACERNLAGNRSTATPVTIGGTRFIGFGFSGVGAGNIYDTTSYRTVRNGQCYALEYVIHYGNIGNYPEGAVTEFDEQKVSRALEEIVRSFQFLK